MSHTASHNKLDKKVFFQDGLKSILFSSMIVIISCVLGFYYLDIPVAYYCESLDGNFREKFKFITEFGYSAWYLIFSVLLFVFFRYAYKKPLYSNQALFIFTAIASSGILVEILKFVFGRYRPIMLFRENLYGFDFFHIDHTMISFPSGHANTITALMLALYFIFPKYKYIYLIVALLVTMSRVILAFHFLTDAVFGSYLAVITTFYLKHLFENRFRLPIN